MLTKTISFNDIDDKKVTEDFYFHVSRADLIEMMIEKPEMEEKLATLATASDGRSIIGLIKEFILISVGRRPEGGRQFVKTQEITNDFRYSGAYDALLWELANNPEEANRFLEGIFPASLIEEIKLRGGNFDDIRQQVADGKPIKEVIANLPDKDWAAKTPPANPAVDTKAIEERPVELPKSGVVDTVEGEVVEDPRTPFPGSLPEAISATSANGETKTDDRPAWLKELREPTSKELLEMNKSEMALAFRMREEGKLNTQNKPVTAE